MVLYQDLKHGLFLRTEIPVQSNNPLNTSRYGLKKTRLDMDHPTRGHGRPFHPPRGHDITRPWPLGPSPPTIFGLFPERLLCERILSRDPGKLHKDSIHLEQNIFKLGFEVSRDDS